MKLKFINTSESERKAKATVHTTGKLGFSSDANEIFALTELKYIAFAENEDDPNDKNLYAIIYESKQDGALKISKAGKYFYVNTKNMFDTLDIDYKKTKVIYDLVKGEHEGTQIIKMLRREINKKNKEMPT